MCVSVSLHHSVLCTIGCASICSVDRIVSPLTVLYHSLLFNHLCHSINTHPQKSDGLHTVMRQDHRTGWHYGNSQHLNKLLQINILQRHTDSFCCKTFCCDQQAFIGTETRAHHFDKQKVNNPLVIYFY